MDQYINIVMATLRGLAAEDWAVAAAVLFCTVFIMRSLRMVRRTLLQESRHGQASGRAGAEDKMVQQAMSGQVAGS